MGMRAIPLRSMKRYVQRVQGLLRGEVVDGEHEGGRQKYGFLDPELGLVNTSDPVALHVSALGPQARRLVADLGAGWINFTADERVAIRNLRDVQKGWHEAGREAAKLYSTLFVLGAVLRPGEAYDSDRVLAQAGPWVTVLFHNLVETTEPGSMEGILGKQMSDLLEAYRAVYLGYPADRRHMFNHRGHLMYVRPEERFLVSAELIRNMTFTGEPDALRERVARLGDAGYNQITVQLVEGQLDAVEDWAAVFRL
jgi:5,10-methylenetetrahydromethanopterin reductase